MTKLGILSSYNTATMFSPSCFFAILAARMFITNFPSRSLFRKILKFCEEFNMNKCKDFNLS